MDVLLFAENTELLGITNCLRFRAPRPRFPENDPKMCSFEKNQTPWQGGGMGGAFLKPSRFPW